MAHIKVDSSSFQKKPHHAMCFSAKGTLSRGKNPINQREWTIEISGEIKAKHRSKLFDKLKTVVHNELHNRSFTQQTLDAKIRHTITHASKENKIHNLQVKVTGPVYKNLPKAHIPSAPAPQNIGLHTPSIPPLPPLQNQNLQPNNNTTLQLPPVPEKVARETLAICDKQEPAKLKESFDVLRGTIVDLDALSDQRILDLIGNALEIKGEMTINEKKEIVEKEIVRAMNETAPKADEDLPSELFLFLTNLSDRVGQIQG